jgi:TolB protein
MIALKYPEGWQAQIDDHVVGGKPTKFEGEDGFFQIGAISGEMLSLDEVAYNEAKHELKPYGSKPVIEKAKLKSWDVVYIFPSKDQPSEMGNQACFIIKYPQRVVVDDQEYDYFMLWADKTHIKDIAESVNFIAY